LKLVKKENELTPQGQETRRRFLALIHIAKKDVGMSEILYRDMLSAMFDVPTAAALNNNDLSRILVLFQTKYDWRPNGNKQSGEKNYQVEALQARAIEFISQIPDGEHRVKGLCRKLCGVDRIEWCKDAKKLKKLLAVMGNIKRREGI